LNNSIAKILLIVGIAFLINACSAVKRVPKGKYLLTKNTITVNNKKITDESIKSFLIQRPNQKILRMPLSLFFYNNANPTYKTAFNNWLKRHPKTHEFLSKVFSEKQVIGLENSYKRLNKWFLKNGDEPVIINAKKVKKSEIKLKQYYFNQGFFDTYVSYTQNLKKNKRASISYNISTHKPYFIDSITTQITSPVLDSIYQKHIAESKIKSKNQFKDTNFRLEEERLIKLFRNLGVYHFGKNLIRFDIDTSKVNHTAKVLLKIPDRIIKQGDSTKTNPFIIQKINKVRIYTDYSYNQKTVSYKDSSTLNNYIFYAHKKLKYNPKLLANSILIKTNKNYNDTDRKLTRQFLRGLQNFSVNINYRENKDQSLDALIFLTPFKKYSLRVSSEITHSNVKPLGLSGKFSFTNRNVFKGAEILELSFIGSFLNSSKDASNNSKLFNAWEIGADVSLKIPRILSPFNIKKVIPKYMNPKTSLKFGTSIQKNIGLDRQKVTGIINFSWNNSKYLRSNFELINMQYIRNFNTSNYFKIFNSEFIKLNDISQLFSNTSLNNNDTEIKTFINTVLGDSNFRNSNPTAYQTVVNVSERRSILVEDVLIPSTSYTLRYNNKQNFKDYDFSFFKASIISSGLFTSIYTHKKTNGQKEIFGLPIAQFIKFQAEYKKYWGLSSNGNLVFRSFIGIAIPYGNSTTIPFSRSYFAGGSNELRAWRAYDLGPGSTKSNLEFNVGNFKILNNLEYRFKMINSIHGALFIDSGNIWDISKASFIDKKARFNGFNSIKDIAIGSGFGVRYDFNFLVFRFDIGFKTYEPYITDGTKWFRHYNFGNAVYNIGINYPF